MGTFFRLQVYERVGISLVEVYEGKSVISVCKMPQMANRQTGHLQQLEGI